MYFVENMYSSMEKEMFEASVRSRATMPRSKSLEQEIKLF